MHNLKNLHSTSKIFLIALVGVIGFFVSFFILSAALPQQQAPLSMMQMMQQSGGGILNFSNQTIAMINSISLIIGIILAFLSSLYLFNVDEKQTSKEEERMRKMLSEDERKALNEVKKAREITQDSLKFRLEWSKAKMSTILTNLDRKGLIQRERTGKTYKISLQNND